MKNAFLICTRSKVHEANLAVRYWTLSFETLVEDYPYVDLEIAEIYFEYLDEYCEYNLKIMTNNI